MLLADSYFSSVLFFMEENVHFLSSTTETTQCCHELLHDELFLSIQLESQKKTVALLFTQEVGNVPLMIPEESCETKIEEYFCHTFHLKFLSVLYNYFFRIDISRCI
jgi:hypothetical protein